MSSTLVGRQGRGLSPDLGELGGLAIPENTPVMRAQLLPAEEAISLPPPPQPQGPMIAMTRSLGPLLTVGNPAWIGDPVPRMRALQKAFVEHSLKLAENDRSELMAAINVVENAVQLRLRLQQMRMEEADMQVQQEGKKKQ